MIKKRKRKQYFALTTRLMLVFCLLLILTVVLLFISFYSMSRETLVSQTAQHMHTMLQMADEIITAQMSSLIDQTLQTMVDEELYHELDCLYTQEKQGVPYVSTRIKERLAFWFSRYEDIVAADIVYHEVAFTYHREGIIRYDQLRASPQWEKIQKGNGTLLWFPPQTSRFFETDTQERQKLGVIWLARTMNMTNLTRYTQTFLHEKEKPVLLLCLQPDVFTDVLQRNMKINEAEYFLTDSQGAVLSGDDNRIGMSLSNLQKAIRNKKSGWILARYDDKPAIYCYSASALTGWTHVVVVKQETVTEGLLNEISRSVINLSLVLIVAMILLAILFFRTLSTAVKKLTVAAKCMENGTFGEQIEYRRKDEFSYLIHRFNVMSRSIRQLIDENYRIKLREKDTQIMALTIQFNPHYLYNTLNSIQWMALKGNVKETSRMILSLANMLRYTSDQQQELTLLREDREWLERYLYLMQARYEDLFEVRWCLKDFFNDLLVPKLFLQPLVENAILHGFDGMESGGILTIGGEETSDALCFYVQDNGCGMTLQAFEQQLNTNETHSIGIMNVQKRIQLIYGEDYGLGLDTEYKCGTRILVRIGKGTTIN